MACFVIQSGLIRPVPGGWVLAPFHPLWSLLNPRVAPFDGHDFEHQQCPISHNHLARLLRSDHRQGCRHRTGENAMRPSRTAMVIAAMLISTAAIAGSTNNPGTTIRNGVNTIGTMNGSGSGVGQRNIPSTSPSVNTSRTNPVKRRCWTGADGYEYCG